MYTLVPRTKNGTTLWFVDNTQIEQQDWRITIENETLSIYALLQKSDQHLLQCYYKSAPDVEPKLIGSIRPKILTIQETLHQHLLNQAITAAFALPLVVLAAWLSYHRPKSEDDEIYDPLTDYYEHLLNIANLDYKNNLKEKFEANDQAVKQVSVMQNLNTLKPAPPSLASPLGTRSNMHTIMTMMSMREDMEVKNRKNEKRERGFSG
ncbi:hypothetical protein L596_020655 [Steinernema carpocapsae]|uniref:Uncharacterized protein n=1 Tax=Steinernema carpocapsae TaxID=34508 RepID=A0A4U5MU70_STECR|nr:hypothetical protein L596_020655 [Steinernema carpocapsae]